MNEKSIIIIGAGLAGLSAGCYAQMNGYRSHIFEHHTLPGGVCTAWKRDAYTVDGCIHWLIGSKPDSPFYKIYQEVGALVDNQLIYLNHYVRFIDEVSGWRLDITSDLDRLATDMKVISPEDEEVIDELINEIHALQVFAMGVPEPYELKRSPAGIEMVSKIQGFLRYFARYNMSVETFVKKYHSPLLGQILMNMFLPEMPVAFLFLLLGQLSDGQLAIIKGGSQKFSLAIAKRYKDLGGKVSYESMVEEILVEDKRAVGIRLADGSEYRADIVVSAADGYSTIFKMLKGRYMNQKIKERYDKWPLFPPILLISFGVARKFIDQPSKSIIFMQYPFTIGNKEVKGFSFRTFDFDSTITPAGKTVVQARVETDFDFWYELQKDRPRYEAEKERVAAEVLKRLETHFPAISSDVEMTDVATPYTFWHYTRNYRGAFEGWLMTPQAMFKQVEKTLPGLNNFYMVGQWVEPGGGIPPSLYSGRNLIRVLCYQDKKPFTTTIP